MISRLAWQKGLDLLADAVPALVARGAQLAVLGTGDPELEQRLTALAQAHRGQVGCIIGYDEDLAHLIQAGADAILVPSRFEPCGLTQLCAMRYGAVPVVAKVGGLADTVVDLAAGPAKATGLQFSPVTREALEAALHRAADLWSDRAAWQTLQANGMRADVSWAEPANAFFKLYTPAAGGQKLGIAGFQGTSAPSRQARFLQAKASRAWSDAERLDGAQHEHSRTSRSRTGAAGRHPPGRARARRHRPPAAGRSRLRDRRAHPADLDRVPARRRRSGAARARGDRSTACRTTARSRWCAPSATSRISPTSPRTSTTSAACARSRTKAAARRAARSSNTLASLKAARRAARDPAGAVRHDPGQPGAHRASDRSAPQERARPRDGSRATAGRARPRCR